MANTSKALGWLNDITNARYSLWFNGSETLRAASSGLTLLSGKTFDLSSGTITLPTRTALIDLEHQLVQTTGATLAATETAGNFHRPVGTNQLWIQGEESLSETEVSVGYLTFTLPENYVSAGTITLRAFVDVQGAGTLGTCTVDFSAYLMTLATGAVGSDLVTTAATAVTATGAAADFTVTPTGLAAGDKLVVKLTTSIAESAGTAIRAVITQLAAIVQVNK